MKNLSDVATEKILHELRSRKCNTVEEMLRKCSSDELRAELKNRKARLVADADKLLCSMDMNIKKLLERL